MSTLTRWTQAELDIVADNSHLGPKALHAMLPRHKLGAVRHRLYDTVGIGTGWGKRKGEHDDLAAWRIRTPCA